MISSLVSSSPSRGTVPTGRAAVLSASLTPGHYLLTFVGGEEDVPTRIPILIGWSVAAIRWDLSHAPPSGFVPIPPGPFLRGPSGVLAETEALYYGARHEVTRGEYRELAPRAFYERLGDR